MFCHRRGHFHPSVSFFSSNIHRIAPQPGARYSSPGFRLLSSVGPLFMPIGDKSEPVTRNHPVPPGNTCCRRGEEGGPALLIIALGLLLSSPNRAVFHHKNLFYYLVWTELFKLHSQFSLLIFHPLNPPLIPGDRISWPRTVPPSSRPLP